MLLADVETEAAGGRGLLALNGHVASLGVVAQGRAEERPLVGLERLGDIGSDGRWRPEQSAGEQEKDGEECVDGSGRPEDGLGEVAGGAVDDEQSRHCASVASTAVASGGEARRGEECNLKSRSVEEERWGRKSETQREKQCNAATLPRCHAAAGLPTVQNTAALQWALFGI